MPRSREYRLSRPSRVRSGHAYLTIACRALAALFALALWSGAAASGWAAADPLSVAVCPFQAISASAEDTTLGSGFAETLTTALSRVGSLRVVERGQLKAVMEELKLENSGLVKADTAARIGELLEARRLVVGALQRSGRSLRVTCRIVDTQTGAVGEAAVVTRRLGRDEDLFTLQDEVCASLFQALGVRASEDEHQRVEQAIQATGVRRAYDLYVEGREKFLQFTPEGYAQAEPLFRQAVELDRGYGLAWAGLSETLALWGMQKEQNGQDARDDYRQALECAQKGVALAPGVPDVYRALSRAYNHAEDSAVPDRQQRCREAARKAIALNPRDAEAHYQLWVALEKPLQGEGAQPIHQALAIDPRLSAAWLDYGAALFRQGKLAEAIDAFQRVTRINPRDANGWGNLGEALRSQGKAGEAETACRRAVEISPQWSAAWINLGAALDDLKRPAEAETALRRALAIHPREVNAWNCLGVALHNAGRYDEAADACRKATELAPERADPWFNLGRTLREQKRYADAATALRKATELDERSPDAWMLLGLALLQDGHADQGIPPLKRYLALAQGDPARQEMVKTIRQVIAEREPQAAATAPGPAVPASALDLSVTGTERVDKVQMTLDGKTTTLRPGQGYKLVIATLVGRATAAVRIATSADDFSAVYTEGGNTAIEPSSAVGAGPSQFAIQWAVPPQGGSIVRTWNVAAGTRLYLKVAFCLPVGVKEFSVRFPAIVTGTAAVEAPAVGQ